ncbi:putative MICOS complex subunit Mic10 protein [Helianthus anomalus]
MGENKEIETQYDLNAKWDACLDLGVRRFVYSSAAGAFAGLLLFRSPVTRWASIAFGAGVGIGSAYSDCSQKFDGSSQTSPSVAETPVAKVGFVNVNNMPSCKIFFYVNMVYIFYKSGINLHLRTCTQH